jgi:hypothetical protein
MRSEQREFPQLNPATSDHVPWVFEGVNPEDEILITHAGGFHHINAFIKGKSIGYSLEQGGLGIQVNPTMATHAKCLDYAQRTNIINSLDSPAILIGTIKSKYLHRANNTYEAGLRTEHLEHLQNIRVFKLPFLWLGLQKAIDESIMIMGIHHNSTCPGLKSRLQKSYACLRQHSKENEIHWSRIYRAHYEEVKATLDSSTLKRLTSFTV